MSGAQVLLRFSAEERAKLERLARKAGLSIPNYIRRRLELEPRSRGGARENAGRRKAETTSAK
jgi:hypothetical protein